MSTTHEQLPLINEGFAFKKAGERITHSEWNAIIELLTKCYNDLVVDTDLTANTILAVLADKAETDHTHDTTDITGLSTLLDTKVSTALTLAKTSGEFDGTGIESVVLENGNLIITLTTGETLNLGNVKGEKGDKGDDGSDGKDGADYILTDDDKSEIAAQVSGDCVSYSEAQALTDEQKETARNNIDAVDANLVVSSILDSSAHPRALKIPNVTALQEFIDEYTMQQCVRKDVQQEITEYSQEIVRSNIGAVSQTELENGLNEKVDASLVVSNIISDTGSGLIVLKNNIPNGDALAAFVREHGVSSAQTQSLTLTKKARARQNIDVDGGTWELLRTYTTNGVDKNFNDGTTTSPYETTTDENGNVFNLSAVAVIINNVVAAATNSYSSVFVYSTQPAGETLTGYAGYAVCSNSISTTAGARAASFIQARNGYYESTNIVAAKATSANYQANPSQTFGASAKYPINKIKIVTGAIPPAGDIIEIWGIKV